ncbi:MAG: hypothetical protein Q4P18_00415 [Methanobrevibacter sp.]|uniref:hypothetical protein n=1 Tax=Methanobrevibacter sp. TaxID=66852 RepID=UPI0026E0E157|nr:hypothetical protein [Methanobrevibacter sp.]MDO5847986.1 hypothetical protein [Methanobrevibacter sp.]
MNDKGYFEIIDGILAIILIFTVFSIFNLVLSVPNESVSSSVYEFKSSQDIMEQLSSKVDVADVSFLEEITNILKENKNSKRSVKIVSSLCDEKFKILGLKKNYYFTETNHLNKDKISSNGNINAANNLNVASRFCDDYYYVLYTW